MNRQFRAALGAVREFISGQSADPQAADADNKALRRVVAAELLATMTPRETALGENHEPGAGIHDTQEIPNRSLQIDASPEEQERARQLFLDHGYFDEAIQDLRGASSPEERASAARALGVVGSQRGIPHLIAACFDDEAEVREAAEAALARIGKTSSSPEPSETTTSSQSQAPEVSPTVEPPPIAETIPAAEAEPVETSATDSETVTPDPVQVEDVPIASVSEATKAPQMVSDDATPKEPEQLRIKEKELRKAVEELERRLLKTAAARKDSEKEAQQKSEREATLRAEAAARRKQEEEALKKFQEEAEQFRLQEEAAAQAEHEARVQASARAHQLQEQEAQLRLEAIGLRNAVAELAQERGRIETVRHDAAQAAKESEARKTRQQAEAKHKSELNRLRSEEERLRESSEEVAMRRTEVEKAREKAEKEAQLLKEAEERMRATEGARVQAEMQRQQVETGLNERLEKERRRLEEAKVRAAEEQKRLEDEDRRHRENEARRMASLDEMKAKAERESKERVERERHILSQVESLRIADAETRRRIEDAETKRRSADQAYSLVADKVQRVEAEAHARAQEEQKILAKLEAARRDAAVEAQARAEQEKRIKDELEMFRRLEEEERPRLEVAILRRSEAEEQLQQLRERLEAEEEEYRSTSSRIAELPTRTIEPRVAAVSSQTIKPPSVPRPAFAAAATAQATQPSETDAHPETVESPGATPTIVAYLNSVDPYKRAAAVAELARSQANDAFSLIAGCFDDHSAHVRNAAARALPKLEPNRTVDLFNRAMEEGSEERRRNIGAAIAESGLAAEAINNLAGESREATYNALSILFVMAKSGEVQPLVSAIEQHRDDEIGKAATKLLTLSGKQDVAEAALKRGTASA